MVYVEVDFIDFSSWFLSLVLVDSSIFEFHNSFSFDDSQSKQGFKRERVSTSVLSKFNKCFMH
jgi:hypothetical protein